MIWQKSVGFVMFGSQLYSLIWCSVFADFWRFLRGIRARFGPWTKLNSRRCTFRVQRNLFSYLDLLIVLLFPLFPFDIIFCSLLIFCLLSFSLLSSYFSPSFPNLFTHEVPCFPNPIWYQPGSIPLFGLVPHTFIYHCLLLFDFTC